MSRHHWVFLALPCLLIWSVATSAGDGPAQGTLQSKDGSLFVVEGKTIRAVKSGAKIPGDKMLVTPPGASAIITHNSGVQLTPTGNLSELSSPPVQDVAFKLLPADAADIDLELERGRVI